MSSLGSHAVMVAARAFGGASLLALGLFLLWGPVRIVDLGLGTAGALGFDGLLCLAFFLQHSGMVRRSFRERLAVVAPSHFSGAIYAIASGVALIALLILWQPTDVSLIRVVGPFRWFLRAVFLAGVFGFLWGIRSLGSMDAFGIRPIKAALHGKTLREQPLKIRGPYTWVRHPLYLFVLVLLWSSPDLTADRLLLNVTWTAWVFIGTVLEERDLVASFGDQYREYQMNVSMIIPLRMRRPQASDWKVRNG